MEVTPLVWGLTIAAIGGLLLFDFVFHVRKAHVPTLREAAIWSGLYVGLALLFGVGVLVFGGASRRSTSGLLTEKACRSTTCSSSIIMTSSSAARSPQKDCFRIGSRSFRTGCSSSRSSSLFALSSPVG